MEEDREFEEVHAQKREHSEKKFTEEDKKI